MFKFVPSSAKSTLPTYLFELKYPFCRRVWVMRDLPSPQCQPNQTYYRAGDSLLTLSAGLWARAQACHQY